MEKIYGLAQCFQESINFLLKRADHGSVVLDLVRDLQDGTIILELLQYYEGFAVGGYYHRPVTDERHRAQNFVAAKKYLEICNMNVSEVRPEEMVAAKVPQAMFNILWKLVLRYIVNKHRQEANESETDLEGESRTMLIEWCNLKLSKIGYPPIKAFDADLNDGVTLCHLFDAVKPGVIDIKATPNNSSVSNITELFDAMESFIGVGFLVPPSYFAENKYDPRLLMVIVAFIRNFDLLRYGTTNRKYEGGLRPNEELTFEAGRTIELMQYHDNWWRGKVYGYKVGWVPADHVTILTNAEQHYAQEASKNLRESRSTLSVFLDKKTQQGEETVAAAASIGYDPSAPGLSEKDIQNEESRYENLKANDPHIAALLNDLISNAQLVPDLMLKNARSEQEIEQLEAETQRLLLRIQDLSREHAQEKQEIVSKISVLINTQAENRGAKMAEQLMEDVKKEQDRSAAEHKRHLDETEQLQKNIKDVTAEGRAKIQILEKTIQDDRAKYEKAAQQIKELHRQLSNEQIEKLDLQLRVQQLEANMDEEKSVLLQETDELQQARSTLVAEKKALIKNHEAVKASMQEQVDRLSLDNETLQSDLESMKRKLAETIAEFEKEKASFRQKDTAAANYKVQLLNRIKDAESSRDENEKRRKELEEKLNSAEEQKFVARQQLSAVFEQANLELEREKKKAEELVKKEKIKAATELEKEIRRAEEEAEKLRDRMEEERDRRERLEAMEHARMVVEEHQERLRKQRGKTPRMVRSNTSKNEIGEKPDSQPTTTSLMKEFKKQNANMDVPIYPTANPDIFTFGTKRLHVVVLNGQLMVRVGGGYMRIDDFVVKHAPVEARKMQNKSAR